MKKGQYVKGVLSPFVHGKVDTVVGAFAYLTDGSVYPTSSLKKSTKKDNESLPNFRDSLRNSKSGLNIYK